MERWNGWNRWGWGVGLCLGLSLGACANSPFGSQVERSLAADPQLLESPSPSPSVPSPSPQTPNSPTVSPSVESTPPPDTVTQLAESAGAALQSGMTNAPESLPVESSSQFTDLDQAPAELLPYLEDLAKLGVLTPAPELPNPPDRNPEPATPATTDSLFRPNDTVTRRDYARWLVVTNNKLYGDRPTNQIRLGLTSEQPVFQDVPSSDRDFAVIQGLADAGIIPSTLSGSSTTTFRPDAPLTREDLIRWKVPLDVRQNLPTATVDTIQQTWGFQDANRIDPDALRAVLADYQNGEQSNIRRAFGYTTLFQPQKPVTRAEAAAVVWQFGYQGDGISVADALATPAPDATAPDPASDNNNGSDSASNPADSNPADSSALSSSESSATDVGNALARFL